jgi:phospholipase/lecithinase/hemolysin
MAPAWSATAPNYQAMYVFGDSLSDTGNDFISTTAQRLVPAIPPSVSPYATYWQGRFSNGPVAVEYLWRLLGRKNAAEVAPFLADQTMENKAGVSFAFGGSASGISNPTPSGFVVPGLLGQVDLYTKALNGKKARPNALYTVWTGSNDYLQGITGDPYTVVGNVAQAIRVLYASGARDFMVPNLPNLGRTPLILQQNQGAAFTQLTKAHNDLLEATLTSLSSSLPKARIVRVDVYALGEALLDSGVVSADVPAVEFLAPNTGAVSCLFTNPAACIDVPMTGALPPFLFWDVLHPTTQVHGAIGTAMMKALTKANK